MKITAVLLLVAALQVSARGFTQNVSLSVKNAPIDKVFAQLKKQTAYNFVYANDVLRNAKTVTLNIKNASIEEVLQLIFKDQPLSYSVVDNVVVVKIKETTTQTPNADATNVDVNSQIDISGKVTDTEEKPLVGANVKVKGTTKGTTTNENGVFVLKGIDDNATLEISYVGYELLTLPVNGRTSIVTSLKLNPSPLDQIQIIAYGQTTKRLLTGNVGSVKSADIEKQPVQNPLLALQGRVPGLVVTQNSGVPGGGVTVRIQGQNSISNGNDPLYIIDGVPVPSQLPPNAMGYVLGESGSPGIYGNPLSYLDINSIESIEVLKDADATAIYGSRAANGAILITTRRGKIGRTSFDLQLESGVGKLTRHLQMMNTRQYLDMRYEALKNDGLSIDSNRDYDLTLWDTTKYTDWQKELLGGTAKYQDINATLQGGTSAMTYRISGTYHNEKTVFPGDFADEKASVNFAITNKSPNGKFNLVFSGNYLHNKNRLPSQDLTPPAIGLAPDAPSLYNTDGTINWAPTSSGISTFTSNPIIRTTYEDVTDNLVSNLTVSYSLSRDLSLKMSTGYNLLRSSEFMSEPLSLVRPENRSLPQQIWGEYGDRKQEGWNIEPQINYDKKIQNHSFAMLAGLTLNSNTTNAGSVIGYDYLSDALLRDRAAAATLKPENPTTMSEYRYNAFFGRVSYNYLKKYIINFNARRDGSSRFGKENKFENFGSIGAAWIFTDEKFLQSSKSWLSFGKFKLSYGTTGSDQIPDYNYLSLYSLQNISNVGLYQGVRGLEPFGLPNPHLQWEKTKKFNAGVDLGFFENRILLNINYGVNRSSNQLLNYVLASTAGYQTILSNFPALIENNSFEVALNTRNFKRKYFLWTSNINLTIPKNKLVEFPNLESSSYRNTLSIGQPIGVAHIYQSAGVNSTTGYYQFYTKLGHITSTPTTEDMILLNTSPKFYGGIENSFSYKNFQLDFLFQLTKQIGQNVLITGVGTIPGRFSVNSATSNQPVSVLDRWQKPGDQSLVEKFSTKTTTSFLNTSISSAVYSDASFIRLKNVSISYLIPHEIGKRVGLSSGRLFFQAQNILTVTDYKGLDPENAGYPATVTLPPLCVMTFGIQLSF